MTRLSKVVRRYLALRSMGRTLPGEIACALADMRGALAAEEEADALWQANQPHGPYFEEGGVIWQHRGGRGARRRSA